MKKYIIIIIVVISFFGCKKEMISYTGDSGVFFYLNNLGRTFTMSYGTVPGEIKDSIVKIRVDLMGHIVHYDREIKFSVVENDTMSARAGINYEFVSEKYYIPADSNRGYISIKLKRTPGLDATGVVFRLNLEPTNELKLLYPIRYEESTVSLNVYIDEYTPTPGWWGGATFEDVGFIAFGEFSATKSNYVCDMINLEYDPTVNREEWPYDKFLEKRGSGRIKSYGIYVQQRLNELAAEGIIIMDEPKVVGKDTLPAVPMVMGRNSQIN